MSNVHNNKVVLPPISNILRESAPVYHTYPVESYGAYSVPRYEMPPPPVGYARYDVGRYDVGPRFEMGNRFTRSPKYEISRTHVSPRTSFDTTPRFETPVVKPRLSDGGHYEKANIGSPETPVMSVQPLHKHSQAQQEYPVKGMTSPGASKRKTRNNLPKETTYILISWLNDHLSHPYPNSFEKNQLMMATGLNHQQLLNWFINARRRKIKMLKEQKKLNA